MKKKTYVRAAKKSRLSTVFESHQLDPSKIEKDLVNYLVKLDVRDDLGDPATVFVFIKNNPALLQGVLTTVLF